MYEWLLDGMNNKRKSTLIGYVTAISLTIPFSLFSFLLLQDKIWLFIKIQHSYYNTSRPLAFELADISIVRLIA
jgi:hypothetical protein